MGSCPEKRDKEEEKKYEKKFYRSQTVDRLWHICNAYVFLRVHAESTGR